MSSNEVYANILTISWNLWLADALEFILENLHICKNTFFLVPHTHIHLCGLNKKSKTNSTRWNVIATTHVQECWDVHLFTLCLM